jgi:hypothetical protein
MTKAHRHKEFANGVRRALKQAASDARQTARRFGTPIYVWENGKVVAKTPTSCHTRELPEYRAARDFISSHGNDPIS